jgi:O-antigen/teichoic acid export membrane protein
MNDGGTSSSNNLSSESRLMVKHSLVYGLGNIMNRVIGFLMIPIYTQYLLPSEYGILELVSLTTEFLGMILSLRISRAMYRFYFEYEAEDDRKEVISTAVLSFGAIGIVGVAFACLASGQLAEGILDSKSYGYYFIISFSTLWFNTIVLMGYDYVQMLKRSILYVILSSGRLVINLSLNIYFIVWLKMGVAGILYGNLVSAILMTCVLVVPILMKIGVRISRKKLKEMLAFGLPLIPGALANFIVLVSDRYLVKLFGSLSDTGIYSLSYRFGTLPHTLITVPFFQIWSVRRFELFKDESSEDVMGKIITYFLFIITFVGLGISVLIKDTIQIMADPKFWDAYMYIPILVLSYLVFGLFNHFAFNILIEKKTKYLSYIDIANGILNVILNIVLIKRYGIWGAAFATLISYSLRIAMIYFVSRSLGKIYFEFARAGKILFVAGGIYAASTFIDLGSPSLNLVIKFSVALTFPMALFLTKFYKKEEIEMAKSIFLKRSFRRAFNK